MCVHSEGSKQQCVTFMYMHSGRPSLFMLTDESGNLPPSVHHEMARYVTRLQVSRKD